jgi:hypothetical protein
MNGRGLFQLRIDSLKRGGQNDHDDRQPADRMGRRQTEYRADKIEMQEESVERKSKHDRRDNGPGSRAGA